MAAPPATNSLGLDFAGLDISAEPAPEAPTPVEEVKPARSQDVEIPRKNKPYLNPTRGDTGGIKQDKLSDEQLAERMAKMREQNEKIKQRRLDVAADEAAFVKTQESERIKQAAHRKVQENVNRTREENAKRKMNKIGNREWDSEKRGGPEWKTIKPDAGPNSAAKAEADNATSPVAEASSPTTRGGRGGGRGGRGGRSNSSNFDRPKPPHQASQSDVKPAIDVADAPSSAA